MTPKQEARINYIKSIAETLSIAKKQARITARAEAKAFFNARYAELKQSAITEYYKAFHQTVDVVHKNEQEKRLNKLMANSIDEYEDDDTDELN